MNNLLFPKTDQSLLKNKSDFINIESIFKKKNPFEFKPSGLKSTSTHIQSDENSLKFMKKNPKLIQKTKSPNLFKDYEPKTPGSEKNIIH